MTAPTPDQIAEAVSDVKRIRGTIGAEASEDYYRAENVLIEAAVALAVVTAEPDQARQMLADAWDEGVSFGWHSTELRTDENPYRKAGL